MKKIFPVTLGRVWPLWLAGTLWLTALHAAGPDPADLARRIREAGLDPTSAVRIRDVQLRKEDARIFFNDGVLVFLRAVDGRRFGAVFSAEAPGDDAEILVLPPSRAERASLAAFTQSPNLEEHFTTALLLFTDDTAETIERQLRASGFHRPAAEEGQLLASRWASVLRNLSASLEVRLVEDLLAQRQGRDGIFFAVFGGKTLGNFDLVLDPRQRRQLLLGQITSRQERAFYDIWTHFTAASHRQGRPPVAEADFQADFQIEAYQIDAEIAPNLNLTADTVIHLKPRVVLPVVPLEISPRMNVLAVEVDGRPAAFFRSDSLRANLLRGDQNDAFLVVPPEPLPAGQPHRIRVRHQGAVISEVGKNVYFVASRINWYPQRGVQFARYDLTFRCPKELTLVTTGELVEERTEGDWRVSRRQTNVPIRFAAFNLGRYEVATVNRRGYRIDLYANRELEDALAPRPTVILTPPPASMPRRSAAARLPEILTLPPVSGEPGSRLKELSEEIGWAMEWMASHFGPPPLPILSVSPIPGNFGQGFPGLIYLSTRAFVDLSDSSKERQLFFEQLLPVHETAHQWWGNLVTSASYEDDWLLEAIANYMAVLSLEQRRGQRLAENILTDYRDRLLTKDSQGQEAMSAGPVVLGLRLQNSQNAGAWRTVIYDKGSWILHMMRRRLGDELFWEMLSQTARRFRQQPLTTEQFRAIAAEALAKQPAGPESYRTWDPRLESFFDTWVYGTGMPRLKLTTSLRGKAPQLMLTLTLEQSEVGEDFSDLVPVEITVSRNRVLRRWIRTGSEPASITVRLAAPPLKVALDPGRATLRR